MDEDVAEIKRIENGKNSLIYLYRIPQGYPKQGSDDGQKVRK